MAQRAKTIGELPAVPGLVIERGRPLKIAGEAGVDGTAVHQGRFPSGAMAVCSSVATSASSRARRSSHSWTAGDHGLGPHVSASC